MKAKILVTRKLSDGAEEKLKKNFDVTLNLKDEPILNSELIKMANEYDGFISTGFDKIGEDFFKDLNGKLKIIAQVGVGYDNISIKSAEIKKIKVTNTPNVLLPGLIKEHPEIKSIDLRYPDRVTLVP